jgi:transmembrane 9 superfamily protein 2/4
MSCGQAVVNVHADQHNMFCAALAVHLLFLLPPVYAFYLPGAAPRNYKEGEDVELLVNALTPMLSGSSDSKLVSSLSAYLHRCIHSNIPKEIPNKL